MNYCLKCNIHSDGIFCPKCGICGFIQVNRIKLPKSKSKLENEIDIDFKFDINNVIL